MFDRFICNYFDSVYNTLSMKKVTNNNLIFAILAVDIVLFTIKNDELLVRLVEVTRPPHFNGTWGLPGSLISPTETASEAVERLIEQKALIKKEKIYYEQLYTFSKINRDPRGRVVSVGYLALVPWESLSSTEQLNTGATWKRVSKLKNLAYDHDEILDIAIKRLSSRITYTTLSSKLLPKKFTLTKLEKIFEIILEKDVDKRNFRKRLFAFNIVKKSKEQLRGMKHRPANLYFFSSSKIKEINII